MGCTDRWGALPNSNGVVSRDRLGGLVVVDGIYGPMGLEFGTMGSALGQLMRSRLCQGWVPRFGAVACLRG
jgi:hypothetical protein